MTRLFVAVAAVAGAIIFLALRIDWLELSAAFQQVNWPWLIGSAAAIVGAVVIRSTRLAILLDAWPEISRVIHGQNVGYLVNSIVPMRAGEMVTVLLVGQSQRIGRLKALAGIIVDRVIDLIAVVCLFALFSRSTDRISLTVWYGTLGLGAVMLIGLFACVIAGSAQPMIRRLALKMIPARFNRSRQRALDRIDRFVAGLSLLRDWRRAALISALTLVFWTVSILGCWLAVRASWPAAPVAGTAFALAIGLLGTAATSAPGGIGVLHVSLVFGLGLFGVPQAHALAAAVAYHALTVMVSALLGFWSLRHFGLHLRTLLNRSPGTVK